ncbi:glycosyltransferase [Salinivibrio kushneri]|uniref:glycosyltransferase n=1 Tax=Salinivibrio kushneri TaxID=1908198 RepID=UPI003999FF3C
MKNLIPIFSNKDLYEVIIIDDSGKENVNDAVDSNQSNLLVKRFESNRGAGAARNIGLDLASRDYVTFVDADDEVDEKILRTFLHEIESMSSSYDIYFFSPQSHKVDGSEGSRSVRYSRLVKSYISDGCDAIRYKFHVPWSKIYRRKFIKQNCLSFDEVSASNDVMFSLKTGIHAKDIFVSERTFYSVKEHNSGLTVEDSIPRLLDRLGVVIRYNEELGKHGEGKYRISIIPLLIRLYKKQPRSCFKYLAAFRFKIIRDCIPSFFMIKNYGRRFL